jgi:hypothetical protein
VRPHPPLPDRRAAAPAPAGSPCGRTAAAAPLRSARRVQCRCGPPAAGSSAVRPPGPVPLRSARRVQCRLRMRVVSEAVGQRQRPSARPSHAQVGGDQGTKAPFMSRCQSPSPRRRTTGHIGNRYAPACTARRPARPAGPHGPPARTARRPARPGSPDRPIARPPVRPACPVPPVARWSSRSGGSSR